MSTVSPGEGRNIFFSAFPTQLSSGGMKVMVRRNHFVVVSSIFSVLLRPASSDTSLLSANILYWSPVPSVSCVFAFPFAKFIMFKYIYHVVPSNKLPFLMACDPCQRNSNESSYTVFYISLGLVNSNKTNHALGHGKHSGVTVSLFPCVLLLYLDIWRTHKEINMFYSQLQETQHQ